MGVLVTPFFLHEYGANHHLLVHMFWRDNAKIRRFNITLILMYYFCKN